MAMGIEAHSTCKEDGHDFVFKAPVVLCIGLVEYSHVRRVHCFCESVNRHFYKTTLDYPA
ncbi:hypothetical protein N7449_007376 [Penicillium cf. viridicatum]|uniref:Uncharacterized protein n=1 Tax=Penicillium cf. viridicatum TaxID=2972119 RepID=A0A9W9ME49_9EURO|nr:hypothetical protein N7449_007376 [Penicillium cf. viridicatum]